MKTVAMIPARYAASRFPGKLMQMLGNKTVISHTYENTMATRLFDEVIVVTDSELIFNEITGNGGYVIMSRQQHESGSDRIAEAALDMEADIIINVQGDEPFVDKNSLEKLVMAFEGKEGEKVQVASLMQPLNVIAVSNPNIVKVVVDKNMDSLLFSRSIIPFSRNEKLSPKYYRHIGIYAFRKNALLQFTNWPVTPLEYQEKIECLRYLENGIKLKMVLTDNSWIAIDTPEDLEAAKKHLKLLEQ